MPNLITLFILGVAAYVLLVRDDDDEDQREPVFPPIRKGSSVTRKTAEAMRAAMWADDVDLEEFRLGLQEEAEHEDITGGDWEMTAQIALEHLDEDPEYYSKLKRTFG